MSENFYEDELRETLRGEFEASRLNELGDSSSFFAQLAKAYPTSGSKIDWGSVPGSIEKVEPEEILQAEKFTAFIDEIVRQFSLEGDVIYVGDSITDFAITGSLECMRKFLPEFLAIPQHHYLIGPEASWCFCLTMEGDMAFGFQPLSPKIH